MTLKTSFNQSAAHRRDKKFLLILLGLNILGFMATILVHTITNQILQRERQKIFDQSAEQIQQWVEERMLAHVNTLRGLQAFWSRNPEGVTKEEFSAYIHSLNILSDYPGISSVIFIKPSGKQLLTTYIEPLSGREAALGFDSNTDPFRKTFFESVRDSGQIMASDPVALVTTGKPGFFLAVPLYENGEIPRSLEERRNKLIGFAVLVFRESELFRAIFGRQNPLPDIDFVVYHEFEEPRHQLFDSNPEFNPGKDSKLMRTERYVTVGETPWTIIITAKPSFSLNRAEEKLPLFILTTGLAFNGALGLIIIYFYRLHLKKWH